MALVFHSRWENRFANWLNSSAEFAAGARWFDGSVLFAIGERNLWLKIYDGRVIDFKTHPSPLGFTLKLSASTETWRALVEEGRNEILAYTGAKKILAEGNLLEFMRLTKMVIALVDGLRAVLVRTSD
jgi:hypothetical protein